MILLTSTSTSGISDDLKGAIITALVTGIISIIGFIVTNLSMRKSFKNELIKQRDSIALEQMATMPYEVLDMMDRMIKAKNEHMKNLELEKFKQMMNGIYSYGSENAITLVALMQEEIYTAKGDEYKLDKYRLMSFYVLLATQIKYDVTGICVNPELWFKMKLTDYENDRENIKRSNNKIVDELNLNSKMKIV